MVKESESKTKTKFFPLNHFERVFILWYWRNGVKCCVL